MSLANSSSIPICSPCNIPSRLHVISIRCVRPNAFAHVPWVVYAKPPFGGPQHVLEYLGRYTHRVAISNQRLLAMQDAERTQTWPSLVPLERLQT